MVFGINVLKNSEPIGGRLQSARLAVGLTVDDVVFQTHLPRSVVVALESGNYSTFTSPVYAKSFLAQYSDFLNVEAQPWLDALEPGSFVPDGLLRPLVDAPEEPPREKVDSLFANRGAWWPVFGLFALTAALLFAAIKSYDFFEAKFGGEPRSSPQDSLVKPVDPTPQRARPDFPVSRIPAFVKETEDPGRAPPRAIIVR
jgi:cytoskeletal protein RodZ